MKCTAKFGVLESSFFGYRTLNEEIFCMIGSISPNDWVVYTQKNTVCHLAEEQKTYSHPRTVKCIPTKSTNIGLYGKSKTVCWFWRLVAESSIRYRSATRAFGGQTFGKDSFLPVVFPTNQLPNNQTSLTEHRLLVIEWGQKLRSIAVLRLRPLYESQRGQVRNED